jgi:hypothetical protein
VPIPPFAGIGDQPIDPPRRLLEITLVTEEAHELQIRVLDRRDVDGDPPEPIRALHQLTPVLAAPFSP